MPRRISIDALITGAYYTLEIPNMSDDPINRFYENEYIIDGDTSPTQLSEFTLDRLRNYLCNEGHLTLCQQCSVFCSTNICTQLGNSQICPDCYENSYECSICGNRILSDLVCSPCTNRFIRGYDYVPSSWPILGAQNQPHFGSEIEVIAPNLEERLLIAQNLTHQFHSMLFIKHDGSLGQSGLELVTYPMTETWYRENIHRFQDIFETLKNLGCETTKNCGTHFHISRGSLKAAHLYKIFRLVNGNPLHFLRFGDRKNADWVDRYCKTSSYSPQDLAKLARHPGYSDNRQSLARNIKYNSVRTTPNTLELRILGPSKNFETYNRFINLVFALRQFSIDTPLKKTSWDNFISSINDNNLARFMSKM